MALGPCSFSYVSAIACHLHSHTYGHLYRGSLEARRSRKNRRALNRALVFGVNETERPIEKRSRAVKEEEGGGGVRCRAPMCTRTQVLILEPRSLPPINVFVSNTFLSRVFLFLLSERSSSLFSYLHPPRSASLR